MAELKIGFNEGSLLRRTLLHVGTFVIGAVAFIGLMSFVLVSIASKIAAPPGQGQVGELSADEPPAGSAGAPVPGLGKPIKAVKPGGGPSHVRGPAHLPKPEVD